MLLRTCIWRGGAFLFLLLFLGCDRTPLSSSDEITTQTFRSAPGSSLQQTVSSLAGSPNRYICSVTTLNEPGAEHEYSHYTSIHFFPEEEKMAHSSGEKATWSFVFTDESAARSGSTWSHGGYDNVVRVAVCSLPDVEGIEQEMAGRLSESGPPPAGGEPAFSFRPQGSGYQVHTTRHESLQGQEEEPEAGLMNNDCGGYFCGYYFITITSVGGTIISIVIECEWWIYEIQYCDSGGGGSGLPDPPDPGGGGGNNGGGGGDGGSQPCPDPTMPCDTDGNPPDPCTWIPNPPGWVCGTQFDIDEFDIFLDPSFQNTKAECVYNKLKNLSTDFDNAIKQFDGDFPVAHLRFMMENLGPTTAGQVWPPFENRSPDYMVTVVLNNNSSNAGVNYRPNLMVAKTIVHEVIHAEMFRKLMSLTQQGNFNLVTQQQLLNLLSQGDFPGIYDYYRRHQDWQHAQMATHYRDKIADILQEYDNYNHSRQFYMDIAWEGLKYNSIPTWNNLPDSEKTRINNVISNYISANKNETCS